MYGSEIRRLLSLLWVNSAAVYDRRVLEKGLVAATSVKGAKSSAISQAYSLRELFRFARRAFSMSP